MVTKEGLRPDPATSDTKGVGDQVADVIVAETGATSAQYVPYLAGRRSSRALRIRAGGSSLSSPRRAGAVTGNADLRAATGA